MMSGSLADILVLCLPVQSVHSLNKEAVYSNTKDNIKIKTFSYKTSRDERE
jgi:hypothetical protein